MCTQRGICVWNMDVHIYDRCIHNTYTDPDALSAFRCFLYPYYNTYTETSNMLSVVCVECFPLSQRPVGNCDHMYPCIPMLSRRIVNWIYSSEIAVTNPVVVVRPGLQLHICSTAVKFGNVKKENYFCLFSATPN